MHTLEDHASVRGDRGREDNAVVDEVGKTAGRPTDGKLPSRFLRTVALATGFPRFRCPFVPTGRTLPTTRPTPSIQGIDFATPPSHPLNPGLFPDFCGKPLRWETSRGRTSAPSELMSRTQPRTGCVRPAVKTSAWASPCPGTEAEDNRGSLLAGSFPSVALHWDGLIAGRARGEFRCEIHCPRYRSR